MQQLPVYYNTRYLTVKHRNSGICWQTSRNTQDKCYQSFKTALTLAI